jgi:hypothetical protein
MKVITANDDEVAQDDQYMVSLLSTTVNGNGNG